MENMVTEYISLSPYETQDFSLFPHNIKPYVSPNCKRLGIKNVIENLTVINISFLNSLNILLRPDLYDLNLDDHVKSYLELVEVIRHKIHRNFQIDKVKNTKKVQAINQELIKNLIEGKICHDLIQCVVNIFEINLLVFDFTKMEISLYWARGHKYPYLNLFKDIYSMAFIHGNYEPIMPLNDTISQKNKHDIYKYLLTHISEINSMIPIKLSPCSLLYIYSWDISVDELNIIYNTFFHKQVPLIC
ncbi:hypothetical protein H012_gp483 [Acanthamoeba polyphaga moumouvirus]|uniref:Uncharacterized protein n=2 Tax=Moumouvirus TaxID=3080801 RepID=L7RCG1_9VIRU|nr:hypothetical protein H012_gp483 [Acanthamoeba polyphaga moumouvirus]AEX62758.1 hypothetical protein mv_R553 [Moumouvirus Monve]AGC01977.1 hypothetical protein Moumou_00441 [Acanthamoeba polyphaga moumouvirus]